MKIAVSATGSQSDSAVDPRFGRARCFMVFDDNTKSWETIDNTQNLQAAQGAGIQSAMHIVTAGCNALICGHCGPKAFATLTQGDVAVYTTKASLVKEAVDEFSRGKLSRLTNADVQGHW